MKQKMPKIEEEKVVVDKFNYKPEKTNNFDMNILILVAGIFVLIVLFGGIVCMFFVFDFPLISQPTQTASEVQLHAEPLPANITSAQDTKPKSDPNFFIVFCGGAVLFFMLFIKPALEDDY